jgi:serine protease inhibitor
VSAAPLCQRTSTGRFAFDHPFLVLIRDTKTGTIMFAAQVQRPTK